MSTNSERHRVTRQANEQLQAIRNSSAYVMDQVLLESEAVIQSMAKEIDNSFTEESVMDIMACWEEIYDNDRLLSQLPDVGICARREYVANELAPFVNKWYTHAHEELDFHNSFDLEFVPIFLNNLKTIVVDNATPEDIAVALEAIEKHVS